MAVPPFKFFIEPILRHLAALESGAASDAHEAAAQALGLSDEDRVRKLKTGKLEYRDRASWAFNSLKHAGYAISPRKGNWQLTVRGHDFAQANALLTISQMNELASLEAAKSRPIDTDLPASKGETSVSTPASGDKKIYRLSSRPIGEGGQAEIFEATRKTDGRKFAWKRIAKASDAATRERMRREIDIQLSLKHPNIMPILDWDKNAHLWYVMPLGRRTMSTLSRPVQTQLLRHIISEIAPALEFAHCAGNPHRDVKPQNIIELDDGSGAPRWVLADWGLTRRPLGKTTTPLTRTGILGTEGFAPPEAYRDGHLVGEPGDAYSLGQVIAWATGIDPIPNVAPQVAEPWARLTEPMTRLEPQRRIQLSEVRVLLTTISDDAP